MAADASVKFAEFVALRSSALQRTAYLIAGDVGPAADLVQEALTRAYLAWPRLQDPHRAEAYARTVMTTTAIGPSRWRRRRGETVPTVPETDLDPADRAADLDDGTWLWTCLRRLPVRQRAAIVLRYYEDLTEREAAETMGCATHALRGQVAAALATLRPLVRASVLPRDASG